jgi:hypothetical protein
MKISVHRTWFARSSRPWIGWYWQPNYSAGRLKHLGVRVGRLAVTVIFDSREASTVEHRN